MFLHNHSSVGSGVLALMDGPCQARVEDALKLQGAHTQRGVQTLSQAQKVEEPVVIQMLTSCGLKGALEEWRKIVHGPNNGATNWPSKAPRAGEASDQDGTPRQRGGTRHTIAEMLPEPRTNAAYLAGYQLPSELYNFAIDKSNQNEFIALCVQEVKPDSEL